MRKTFKTHGCGSNIEAHKALSALTGAWCKHGRKNNAPESLAYDCTVTRKVDVTPKGGLYYGYITLSAENAAWVAKHFQK